MPKTCLRVLIALGVCFQVLDHSTVLAATVSADDVLQQSLCAPLLFSSRAAFLSPLLGSWVDRQIEALRIVSRKQTLQTLIIPWALVLGAAVPTAVSAQAAAADPLVPELSGYVTYFNPEANWAALERYGDHFKRFDIFAVSADGHGHLTRHLDFVSQAIQQVRLLPSHPDAYIMVTNDRPGRDKDSALVHRWLTQDKGRNQHIAELLALATDADGLSIDYENINLSRWAIFRGKVKKLFHVAGAKDDGVAYAQFLQELGTALHAVDKKLYVTLEDRTLTAPHPLDWEKIVAAVDLIGFMGYQYHGPGTGEGAIAPPDDVLGLAKLAVQTLKVPPEKFRIDIPLFGFDWTVGQKRKTSVVFSLDRFNELARIHHATVTRDSSTQSARLLYWIERTVIKRKKVIRTVEEAHSVWCEDAISAADKIHKLAQEGIFHVGLWQMGTGGDLSPLFDPGTSAAPISPKALGLRGAA